MRITTRLPELIADAVMLRERIPTWRSGPVYRQIGQLVGSLAIRAARADRPREGEMLMGLFHALARASTATCSLDVMRAFRTAVPNPHGHLTPVWLSREEIAVLRRHVRHTRKTSSPV